MLTVACLWVRGHVPFGVEYVARLLAMAKRRIDRPFRFVCLTDRPGDLPLGVEPIVIRTPRGYFAWWAKVELFNARHGALQKGRVLYLDLDVLLITELTPIIDYPHSFALVPDGAPNFTGKGELRVVKRFNSSVMVWNGGEQEQLFSKWSQSVTTTLHGDQDWIGQQIAPDAAAAMPLEWFPRISQVKPPWPSEAKVVLVKKPKNHLAAARWPWFEQAWG